MESDNLDTITINYLIRTTDDLKRDVNASSQFELGITLLMVAMVMYFGYKKLSKK
jgi:ABC-type phosphate transport system permease subunit